MNPVDTTADFENEAEATVKLATHFLSLVAESLNKDPQTYSTETRKAMLAAYLLGVVKLRNKNVRDIQQQPGSALLIASVNGKASIFSLFGVPFMRKVIQEILMLLENLLYVAPRSSTAYLASVPISSPLISLTQLIQYLIVGRVISLASSAPTSPAQGVIPKASFQQSPSWPLPHSTNTQPTQDQQALPENFHVFMSLHSNPKAFIVTDPVSAFDCLKGAMKTLIEEDLEQELWKAVDLKIPVYNTEDGSDLHSLFSNIPLY
ncbi:hypothetical protein BDQ12DRAFT_666469 [Crucibulum laeve]|uniref:Uncharacterized protein n=1 Tax=Crucibulum laeve TaxID=68775 RepID=A0A5C3M298_9AGAR|nr:hypothetical protein BDQ12DRAFT_666469 [Crucibulum laeve]